MRKGIKPVDPQIRLPDYVLSVDKVRTLKLFEFEGYHIHIQAVGKIFQAILFKNTQWWTHYVYDEDSTREKYSTFEMVRITDYVADMAKALALVLEGKMDLSEEAKTITEVLEATKEKE